MNMIFPRQYISFIPTSHENLESYCQVYKSKPKSYKLLWNSKVNSLLHVIFKYLCWAKLKFQHDRSVALKISGENLWLCAQYTRAFGPWLLGNSHKHH